MYFKMFRVGIFFCLLSAVAALPTLTSVVSIEKNKTQLCLGTIVKLSQEMAQREITASIVTAASCLHGVQASKLAINVTNDVQGVIDAVIEHPYYKPPNIDYDIAIIKGRWSITLTVESIQLSDTAPTANDTLSVSEYLPATAIDWKSCQSQLGHSVRVSTKMLCVFVNNTAVDGSPLIIKSAIQENPKMGRKIVGVAFLGAKTTTPRLFTNIANKEISLFIKKYW